MSRGVARGQDGGGAVSCLLHRLLQQLSLSLHRLHLLILPLYWQLLLILPLYWRLRSLSLHCWLRLLCQELPLLWL